MSRIVFVNGSFVPYEEARIPIMDRGFLFGDGIYEVSAVLGGKLIDNEAHLARLERSLGEIQIRNPYPAEKWIELEKEIVRRNGLQEGLVYMQVTRGVAERDFAFPKDVEPTVVMFTQEKNMRAAPAAQKGAAVITVPDLRWKRRDIKSVALLAQVLAKQAAAEAGVAEAWMVEDGKVTEGGSSTSFIITRDGTIVTRQLSTALLPGITRKTVIRLAQEAQLRVEERAFSVEEALDAQEAFLTSATSLVLPVVSIDGKPVGDGKVGPMVRRLRELYLDMADATPA
ncbi:D-amino-acid transaminase [Enterovirga sp.]|uniref:D-amino-acid transaminase n=1 Tax=Enterovirga sp. TaxID=2026350 RepID=UPI002CB7DF6F|nr:D-amino-acid transaminase [Enterovirga sp.]HMO29929.1 D-amino-acid transaminase [Enterovirga sp.]